MSEQERIEKIASDTLVRVNDFIKFAEAKNAAALTFSSAWILAIFSLSSSEKVFAPLLHTVMIFAIVAFFLACATSIASFYPRLDRSKFTRQSAAARGPNLLYFGNIAEMNMDNFETDLRGRYKISSALSQDYASDLCEQIAINSQIANRKFKLFRWSVAFIAVALSLIAVAPVKFACERLEIPACLSQL